MLAVIAGIAPDGVILAAVIYASVNRRPRERDYPMRQTCTIVVVTSSRHGFGRHAAAHGRECGRPAERRVAVTCQCGHSGDDWECAEHAEVEGETECRFCDHYCPVDTEVRWGAAPW